MNVVSQSKHEKIERKIIRLKELIIRLGMSESWIRRREKEGSFPIRKRLGPRAVGWDLDQVESWEQSLKTASRHGQEV